MRNIAATMSVVLAVTAPGAFAQPGDASGGERLFNQQCKACHTVDKGGRNGIGPNLSGLIGRRAGSVPGFSYSAAMKGSGLTWDAKTLDQFLAAPTKKVPGTKMPISVSDPAKRAAVIAYLTAATAK